MSLQAQIDRALAQPITRRDQRGTGLRWLGMKYRYRLAVEDFGGQTEWAFMLTPRRGELLARLEPEDLKPHKKFVKWAFTGLGRGPIRYRTDGRFLTGYRSLTADEAKRVAVPAGRE